MVMGSVLCAAAIASRVASPRRLIACSASALPNGSSFKRRRRRTRTGWRSRWPSRSSQRPVNWVTVMCAMMEVQAFVALGAGVPTSTAHFTVQASPDHP